MLIRLRDPSGSFDKFIFLSGRDDIFIKFNDSLYISWRQEILHNILSHLAKLDAIQRISDLRRHLIRGNIKPRDWIFELPMPEMDNSYFNQFVLAEVGIDLDLAKQSGHLEIKYQHVEHANWWLVHNLHVNRDRERERTSDNYLRFIFNRHKTFLSGMLEKLPILAGVHLGNFRQFGFSVACNSQPYHYCDLLGAKNLTNEACAQAALSRKIYFQKFLACKENFAPIDNEFGGYVGHGLDYVKISSLNLAFDSSLYNNYTALDLHEFHALFSPDHSEYSLCQAVDDPVGIRFEVAPLVVGAVFAHVDLRGLDMAKTCFRNTDFTEADLRDAKIEVGLMDEETLITLKKAKINDVTLLIEINERIAKLQKIRRSENLAYPQQLSYQFEEEPTVFDYSISSLASFESRGWSLEAAVAEAGRRLQLDFLILKAMHKKGRQEGLMTLRVEQDDVEEVEVEDFEPLAQAELPAAREDSDREISLITQLSRFEEEYQALHLQLERIERERPPAGGAGAPAAAIPYPLKKRKEELEGVISDLKIRLGALQSKANELVGSSSQESGFVTASSSDSGSRVATGAANVVAPAPSAVNSARTCAQRFFATHLHAEAQQRENPEAARRTQQEFDQRFGIIPHPSFSVSG